MKITIMFLIALLSFLGHSKTIKNDIPLKKEKKGAPAKSNVKGILVPGKPNDPIDKAMPEYGEPEGYSANELSEDPKTRAQIIRTSLFIGFKQEATVAQVNGLLKSIEGRIALSFAGNGMVRVNIKDPGNLDKLYSLIDSLKKEPSVFIVTEDALGQPEVN